MDMFKIFKRVVKRLVEKSGRIRDKVADIPSSFLVHFARLKQKDEQKFESYLIASVDEEDRDDAAANASQLVEYVDEIQKKGRNRNKISRKGRRMGRARKGAKRKAVR